MCGTTTTRPKSPSKKELYVAKCLVGLCVLSLNGSICIAMNCWRTGNANPLLKVVAAEYVRDYTLRLTFNTGEVRLVDFTPLMQKGICRKLQDLDYFKSFRLDPFTVDWNDEIGFAPQYLYERGMAA